MALYGGPLERLRDGARCTERSALLNSVRARYPEQSQTPGTVPSGTVGVPGGPLIWGVATLAARSIV